MGAGAPSVTCRRLTQNACERGCVQSYQAGDVTTMCHKPGLTMLLMRVDSYLG